MKKISQVNLWWAKDFSGKAEKLNDKFTIRFGHTFVDFQIGELVPDKKIVLEDNRLLFESVQRQTGMP
jgi:hypothetical protein